MPLCVFGDDPCWALDEGANGAVSEIGGLLPSVTLTGRVGVFENMRLELGEKSAGARNS